MGSISLEEIRSSEDDCITVALEIVRNRLREPGAYLNHPDLIDKYLFLQTAELEHEIFGVIYLDLKLRFIKDEIIFRGTLAHTCVYPREVLKDALKANACFVILYHNHPNGDAVPTKADIDLTQSLKKALAFIDVKVVEHVIVAKNECVFFTKLDLL